MRPKQTYKWFRICFWGLWISMFLMMYSAFPASNAPMSPVFMGLMYIFGLGYLYTMGTLVASVRKSVLRWVGLTMLFPFLGQIVAYFYMRTIAIQESWE